MTLEELAKHALNIIHMQPTSAYMVLVGKLPRKGWPKGRPVGSSAIGRFYMYDAAKVLARLWTLGIVRIDKTEEVLTITVVATGEKTALDAARSNLLIGHLTAQVKKLRRVTPAPLRTE